MASTALTDTQLVILSAAAQREDLRVVLPDRLRGGAAEKVLSTLLAKGLIEAIPDSEFGRVAFDSEAGEGGAYRISCQGLVTIGIESEAPEADGAIHSNLPDASVDGPIANVAEGDSAMTASVEDGDQPSAGTAKTTAQPASPRAGTKLADAILLLERPEGASIDELTAATGWLPHTTRAALTGLRKRGILVERAKRDNGTTIYRMVSATPPETTADSEAA